MGRAWRPTSIVLPRQWHPCPPSCWFTPYYRRFALSVDAALETEAVPALAQYRDFFPRYGYAVVAVDTRGTGASFGARTGMRSPEERLDYHDVIDWVSRQSWCNGAVGITGISYIGAAADFAASLGHEAIKGIMPVSSVWDTWGDMFYPGGLLYTGMIGGYGRLIDALDNDRRDILSSFAYFSQPGLAGPAPVDEDGDGVLLAAALADHASELRHDRLHRPTWPTRRPSAARPHFLDRDDGADDLCRRYPIGPATLWRHRMDGWCRLHDRCNQPFSRAAEQGEAIAARPMGSWRPYPCQPHACDCRSRSSSCSPRRFASSTSTSQAGPPG